MHGTFGHGTQVWSGLTRWKKHLPRRGGLIIIFALTWGIYFFLLVYILFYVKEWCYEDQYMIYMIYDMYNVYDIWYEIWYYAPPPFSLWSGNFISFLLKNIVKFYRCIHPFTLPYLLGTLCVRVGKRRRYIYLSFLSFYLLLLLPLTLSYPPLTISISLSLSFSLILIRTTIVTSRGKTEN